MNTNQFARYKIIDEELRKRESVKTHRLQEIIAQKTGQEVSLRTIQTDLKKMEKDSGLGYFAPIGKDHSKKAYYYKERNYSIHSMGLGKTEMQSLQLAVGLLETYRNHPVFSGMNAVMDKLSGVLQANNYHVKGKHSYIHIEHKSTIAGAEHISSILKAVHNHLLITFHYQKFNGESRSRKIAPYYLKEFSDRWYVIGKEQDTDQIKTFGLERIYKLKTSMEVFDLPIIEVEQIYKYVIGVTLADQIPTKVVLDFNPKQAMYLKTLPFHHTQCIINDSVDSFQIVVQTVINYELKAKILSYGDDVEVISPPELKEEIKIKLYKSLEKYNKKN